MATQTGAAGRKYFDPAKSLFDAAASLDKQTAKLERATSAHFNKYKPYLQNIKNAEKSATDAIGKAEASVTGFFDRALTTIQTQLSGWSEISGQTIGTAAGIAGNPLDFDKLSKNVTSLLNTISPGMGDRMNSSMSSLNLDKVAKAPKLLMSSAEHVVSAIDDVLAIPIAFISTIYYGVMHIIQRINKALNAIMTKFQKLITGFVNALIPLDELSELLSNVGTLASQIQGISTVFSGANTIAQYALQFNTYASKLNGALSTPLDTVIAYLPADVNRGMSQIIYMLDNPENLINKVLPPELTQMFAKISQITGYGFNGNMGFGFETVLKGVQGGVIKGLLTNFSTQYPILGPLVTGLASEPATIQQGGNPTTTNGYVNLKNNNAESKSQWREKETTTTNDTETGIE